MSTPTTATATLPPYRPHQPHLAHHHSIYTPPIPSFRPANALVPSAPRLLYPPIVNSPVVSSAVVNSPACSVAGQKASHGMSVSSSLHSPTTLPPGVHHIPYPTMPTQIQVASPADQQHTRKRRRSREPDWNLFYKNGLPKEIIVIDDDTPEPGPSVVTTSSSATLAAPTTLPNTYAHVQPTDAVNDPSTHHQAKRRRRDDEPVYFDPVHHSQLTASQTTTPYQIASPSQSAGSSDRTASAINTTAPTSLGSLSSNSQYDYEVQPGQKRKRTTRQQIAIEARRREAGALVDALTCYKPPPHPPKKASDVSVKVITDVRPSHPSLPVQS